MENKKIIIIGAGAAGIFAAANIAMDPGMNVIVLEKSSKLLAKVKVSGGGRCNVTNALTEVSELIKNYPRGGKELRGPFTRFGTIDTVKWFLNKGVKLKAETDGRMFPVTDSSQTIIDCLLEECRKNNVRISTNTAIESIEKINTGFNLKTSGGETIKCDKLLIATGGSPKADGYKWLENLGHSIEFPVPSLFTFNLKDNPVTQLAGVSVSDAQVKIAGTKLMAKGPLLITHWGLSGPSVLKLSALSARVLYEKNYIYTVIINWLGGKKEEEVRKEMEEYKRSNPLKKTSTASPFLLAKRLWEYLVLKSGIDPEARWNTISGKNFNKLISNLVGEECQASGKTTFKEEFVTCGGIKLDEVNMATMESKICPGLYFAGEVLDIDGVTGGFNFQSAWTTGWLAARDMAEKN